MNDKRYKMEKYQRFCICCCKPLKEKYRLMKSGKLTAVGEAFATVTQLSVAGEASLCRMCYLTVLHIQKVTEDVDARTRTVRDKVSSAHAFFLSSKRVSGLSSPLQPSPRLVVPSPARKKAKSSDGENRGIARALFQPTEPGTRAETLLPDTLDEPLPHALAVVHHASVISPFLQLHQGFQGLTPAHPPLWLQDCRESQGLNQVLHPTAGQAHPHVLSVVHHAPVIFSISAAPLSIPRPDPSTSPNVAARLSGIPRPEPGALSNSWTSSSTYVICSASCFSHFSISTAPLSIPRPDPSTSPNVAARLSGIPRPEPGALSNSWTSSSTYVICSASCFSHFSISTAPLSIPRPDPSTSPNVAARLSGIPRPEPGALSNSWTSSSTYVICSASCFSHFSISTAPLSIPRPDPSTSPNVAARLSGIPRPEPGALSNSWTSSSTYVICSASCFSHFSISTAPLSIPRPDPSTSPNVAARLSGIPRPEPGALSNSWTNSSTYVICSASWFSHFSISTAPSRIPRPGPSTSPNVAARLSGIPRPEPGALSNS